MVWPGGKSASRKSLLSGRTLCPAFPQAFSPGCREGPAPGKRGRVGPESPEWPVALIPRKAAAWEEGKTAVCKEAGRPGGRQGRRGLGKGAVCSFLTQPVDHISSFRAPVFLRSPVWPTGPSLSPSCPRASSSCALLLRLERIQLLAEAQTYRASVLSRDRRFFVSSDSYTSVPS